MLVSISIRIPFAFSFNYFSFSLKRNTIQFRAMLTDSMGKRFFGFVRRLSFSPKVTPISLLLVSELYVVVFRVCNSSLCHFFLILF
jgi:hypothetical protein